MIFRNGIVSDTLRKAGMPYSIIFGLQLPQIAQIASSVSKSAILADSLWEEKGIRESRLLACHIYPCQEINFEKALALASDVQTQEEADILCFRLLRQLEFAEKLANTLLAHRTPITVYCGHALMRNIKSV